MPDDTNNMYSNEQPGRRQGWGDAFAALPLETPDGDAWQRLQRARNQHARKRWPAWFAAAAVLALAAVLPWQLTRTTGGTEAEAPTRSPISARAEGDIAIVQSEAAADAAIASTAADEPVNAAPAASDNATPSSEPAAKPTAAPDTAVASARDAPKAAQRQTDAAGARSVAAETSPGTATDTAEPRAPRPWPQPATDPQLERLYAESAQLEALVALARDDRVATGAAATLTSAYDAQVAGIDASLREADMDAGQRTALWQQRVDALRQLAGFESTQRALAAQGERYDAMLVSID